MVIFHFFCFMLTRKTIILQYTSIGICSLYALENCCAKSQNHNAFIQIHKCINTDYILALAIFFSIKYEIKSEKLRRYMILSYHIKYLYTILYSQKSNTRLLKKKKKWKTNRNVCIKQIFFFYLLINSHI